MISPFQALLEGKDREFVILETAEFIAVLEKKPLVLGHTILISKNFQDDLFGLSEQDLSALMPFAQKISHSIRNSVVCKKVGVAVIGLETTHAHLHLVPINSADDLNFTRAKLSPSPLELENMLIKIKTNLS